MSRQEFKLKTGAYFRVELEADGDDNLTTVVLCGRPADHHMTKKIHTYDHDTTDEAELTFITICDTLRLVAKLVN